MNINDLNEKFGCGAISFTSGPGELPIAKIANRFATAEIALHGAHVLSYVPQDQQPVLWLSKSSWFEAAKPIRGGIPLCWPWFGGHPSNPNLPSHGFARLSEWRVDAAGQTTGGGSRVVFKLTGNDIAEEFRGEKFELKLTVEVSESLQVGLKIANSGDCPLSFSAALHSYFNVSDVTAISLDGFDGREFIDTLNDSRSRQQGGIKIKAEIDRIYLDTEDACVISDPEFGRKIIVSRTGSRSAVVWNPWINKSQRMPDFGDEEYHNMVCVETANAENDARCLAPGESHVIQTIIKSDFLITE